MSARSIILFLLLSLAWLSGPLEAAEKPIMVIRFTDSLAGPVEKWLAQKGFKLVEDAGKRSRVVLAHDKNGLEISAIRRAFAILPNEGVNISEFGHIEIDWGVNAFPAGSSYEQGVRNEALMVMVFLGDERLASGSFFIPDSPYFIGLFLCHGDDRVAHPYIGRYFKKGGRYVCLEKPEKGAIVTSRFNLLTAYRSYFDKERDDNPIISGIALALDTKKAGGNGRSSAFIREIRFYED